MDAPLRDTHALTLAVVGSLLVTAGIAFTGPALEAVSHHEMMPGFMWYRWQLADATVWTRLAAWVPYVIHQCALWGLIYYAQTRVNRYSERLHPVNRAALLLNGGFALLHWAQSHVTYDGLAQDVHEVTAFGSVTLMLIIVLMMENHARGMIWGRPWPIQKRIVDLLRRYHGYYFAWAITYTFWYHPAEDTPGHLWGFFYTMLLMAQGSLFFTRVHTNRYWKVSLEFLVVIHGAVVASQVMPAMVNMFLFGFSGVFVLTQMHGLGWGPRLRGAVLLAYAAALAVVYSARGFEHLPEVLRVPSMYYLGALLLWGLMSLGLFSARLLRSKPDPTAAES